MDPPAQSVTPLPLPLLQEIMGVLIGSAVIPIALCLMWKKTNKWGAIAGAILGQWFGLVAWLVFAKVWAAVGLKLGFCLVMMLLLVWVASVWCAYCPLFAAAPMRIIFGENAVHSLGLGLQHWEQHSQCKPQLSVVLFSFDSPIAPSNRYLYVTSTQHTDSTASTAPLPLYDGNL